MDPRGRILIVDDNAVNADILRRLLRNDYELAVAATGEECLSLLPAFKPQLVLLDIMMPGMDGYETCRRIKSGEWRLRAGDSRLRQRLDRRAGQGYAAQADDYIVKPFDHEDRSKVRVQFRLWDAQRQLTIAKEQLEIYASDLEGLVAPHEQLTATQDMAVFALAHLVDSRDPGNRRTLATHPAIRPDACRRIRRRRPLCGRVDRRSWTTSIAPAPCTTSARSWSPIASCRSPTADARGIRGDQEARPRRRRDAGKARDQVGGGPSWTWRRTSPVTTTSGSTAADTVRACGARKSRLPRGLSRWPTSSTPSHRSGSTSRPMSPTLPASIIRGSGGHFDPFIVDAFLARFGGLSRGRSWHQGRYPDPDRLEGVCRSCRP